MTLGTPVQHLLRQFLRYLHAKVEPGTGQLCEPVSTHDVNYLIKCVCQSFVHIPGDVTATS